jgi:uncharacterized protein YggE
MKFPKYLVVLSAILLAALSVFVVFKARNAWVERNYIGKAVRDRDTITITGEGKVSSKPDLAKIDLGVWSEGATVAAVQRDNTAKTNAIIDALKKLGVAEDDIQTSNYSLQPKIDWTDGKQNVTGYTLSQMISAKIRNLDNVGTAIETSITAGSNQIQGVQFTIDDPSSVQDRARLEAIADARKKAEALSQALGLKVLKVITFSESSGGYVPPQPMMYKALEAGAVANVAPDIQPGALDVTTNVSVTFEVR